MELVHAVRRHPIDLFHDTDVNKDGKINQMSHDMKSQSDQLTQMSYDMNPSFVGSDTREFIWQIYVLKFHIILVY